VNTYTWDADANSISISNSVAGGVGLTFDALDRMVEQNRGGSYTQIVYGPGGGKLALMNGQTLTKGFVPLSGGATAVYNASGLSYYRHSDWEGSSRLASTPTQGVYYDGAYAPYGENYAETGTTDRNFTGQNQDTISSGSYPLYDFLYREYHPTWGRWVSPDPAGLGAVDPSNPQSWNRYAYVVNNPLLFTDPLGLQNDDCSDPWYASGHAECPCDPLIGCYPCDPTDPFCEPPGGGGCGGGGGSTPPGAPPPTNPPTGGPGMPGFPGNAGFPQLGVPSVMCRIIPGLCINTGTESGGVYPWWVFPPIVVVVNGNAPTVQTPNTPSKPGQTGKYSDYLICALGELANQGFGDADLAGATVLANVAPFAFAAAGAIPAVYAAAIIGGIYDLHLAFSIRATCKQEVYGQ
jgi:RHS repeat-associated protein